MREIRICCSDATGLGVDVFRTLLDFGLKISSADITTSGGFCLLVLMVSLSPGVPPRWQLLLARLQEVCPSDADAIRQLCPGLPARRLPFAIHVSGHDRQGMLHALTHALWEADVAVFRAHVATAPSGEIRDTFWVLDNRDELPQPHRVLEVCDRVKGALGPDVACTVEGVPPGGEGDEAGEAALPGAEAGPSLHRIACKDAASSANLRSIVGRRRAAGSCGAAAASSAASDSSGASDLGVPPHLVTSAASTGAPEAVAVDVDVAASPSHTLLSLHCKDRKGLLYDLLLKLKEVNVRVAFGRVEVDPDTDDCAAELYVQDCDFGRIEDPEAVAELTARVRDAAALPVRIAVSDVADGAATELTVATAVDVGGRGRPRVTFDVTQGLCAAGLGVACADVYVEEAEPRSPSRAAGAGGEEIHRFLVHVPHGGGLESAQDRTALAEVVRAALLGIRTPAGPVARLCSVSAGTSPRGVTSGMALSAGTRAGSGVTVGGRSPALLRSMSEAWKGH